MSIKTSLPGAHRFPPGKSSPGADGVHPLTDDARQTRRWLLRGRAATSALCPTPVRRGLLRLGGVELGAVVWGLERCYFESEHVSLGPGCAINAECWFEGHGRIIVGRDCLFGSQVMILTSDHEISPDGEWPGTPPTASAYRGPLLDRHARDDHAGGDDRRRDRHRGRGAGDQGLRAGRHLCRRARAASAMNPVAAPAAAGRGPA